MKFVRLHDLAKTTSGGTPSRGNTSYYGGDIPWLKSGELPDGEIFSVEETISAKGLENSSANMLPVGTLLIAMYGATVGKLGILTFKATTNQAVCAITPNEELDRDYLFYWLLSIRRRLIDTSFGGAQPNISQAVVRDLKVPWVPITKQHEVASRLKAQLADVEAARQAAQAQLREVDLLRVKFVDAAFDRFSDWQPIGAVAKAQSGYAFKSEDFKTAGVRLLRNTNILPGRVYWDDAVYLDESEIARYPSYVLEEGDILISLDRPLISSGLKVVRVSAADLPSLLLQRVGRFLLKPGAVDPDFLYAFLQSSRFINAISGHDQSLGVPHISPGQVESVELPLLSIDGQKQVASRLKSQLAEVGSIHQAAVTQLAEIEGLPQRILAKAFNAQGDAP